MTEELTTYLFSFKIGGGGEDDNSVCEDGVWTEAFALVGRLSDLSLSGWWGILYWRGTVTTFMI